MKTIYRIIGTLYVLSIIVDVISLFSIIWISKDLLLILIKIFATSVIITYILHKLLEYIYEYHDDEIKD
jgi:hypothetical protein